MTVRDLVEHATFVKNVEIVIRTTGESAKWIQGYRIGAQAKIYPYESRAEVRCAASQPHKTEFLKPGEEADIKHSDDPKLPMKVIAVEPSKMPKNIADLEVRWYQPRHLWQLHGEQLTHNDFDLDIVCYPPDRIPDPKQKDDKQSEDIDGQLSLDEFFEKEQI